MRVDWQTLDDLGILRASGYQASLYDWANFTSTSGGDLLLKERFRAPLTEIVAIRQSQAAVVWLSGHAGLFDPLLGGSAWLTVERYIQSSIAALQYPNRLILWLDSWWVRFLNNDLFREVSAALSLTQTLARHAAEVARSIEDVQLPERLAVWRDELRGCLAEPPLARLIASKEVHRLSPPGVLALDQMLRTVDFGPLKRLASLVYQIDALRSLALATRERRLVLPEVLEEGAPRLEADGLFHPLLDRPVKNSLRIDPDGRMLFLTGPNMAGKSTYLKSVGLALYLAQVGMGVPASVFRFTPFDCLFSGINTTDNLRLGQSYFYAEVRRVREVTDLLAQGHSAFVLFDEMFKGTNLKDASDACVAVLTGFTGCTNSAFMTASHIAELTTALEELDGVQFLQFGAEIVDGKPIFDYKVRPGVSEQRLGMLILEREGVMQRLKELQRTSSLMK